MQKQATPTQESAHQTVTEFIKLHNGEKTIQIGFTDQKVSGRAGLLTFAGILHWHRFADLLVKLLPARTSNNQIPLADLALGFIAGILAGAQKLTHVAHLRTDVMLPVLLAIERIGSQSSFTRFFQRFKSMGQNAAVFRPLFRFAMERLASRPGGYSLDLDSTRLLHEDGKQEGVKVGYTRLGNKPYLCLLNPRRPGMRFSLRDNLGCARRWKLGQQGDDGLMSKLFSALLASAAITLAGCTKTERPEISVNTDTNEITPSSRTDQPVGPATGVGAGSAASSGMGPVPPVRPPSSPGK